MTIAPQNIIADLRGMSDQQLSQYAQMHQNDPYVFPLAFQESQTRKQMRAQSQAMMAGQKPPTVVQQDVGQMAPSAMTQVPYAPAAQQPQEQEAPQKETKMPEEQGIGALSAKNLEGMKDGGVVGYAPGGLLPGSDATGVPIYAQGSFGPQAGLASIQAHIDAINSNPRMSAANKAQLIDQLRAGIKLPPQPAPQQAAPAPQQTASAPQQTASAPQQTVQAPQTSTAAPTAPPTAPTAPPAAPPAPDQQGLGALTAVSTPSIPSGLPGYMKYAEANTPALPDKGLLMQEREQYLGAAPTEKQMQRLKDQEAKEVGEKDDAKTLALLRAGLGMMAGTSPHALENIGKGAQAGVEDYAAAMKEFKKADLERDKARDAIENTAYALKAGNYDAAQRSYEKAQEAQNTYKGHELAGIASIQGGETAGKYSLAGQQVAGQYSLEGHRISAKANQEYMNALRGSQLGEKVLADVDREVKVQADAAAKAYKPLSQADQDALRTRLLQQRMSTMPNLAQYVQVPTGGGLGQTQPSLRYNPQTGKIE
jgi:hypothetical protein